MGSALVLVGASVLSFLLILLFVKLGDGAKKDEDGNDRNPHVLLQILLLGFILATFVLIGKASLDGSDNCAWLVNQSIVSGNSSTYTYDYQCENDTKTTSKTFYRLTVWIMYLVGIYVFCYLIYIVLVYFGYLGRPKKGREE